MTDCPDVMVTESSLERVLALTASSNPPPDPQWLSWVSLEYESLFSESGIFGVCLVDRKTDATLAAAVAGFLVPEFSNRVISSPNPWVKRMAYDQLRAGNMIMHECLDRDPESFAKEACVSGVHLHFFVFDWQGMATGHDSMKLRSQLGIAFYDRFCGIPLRLVTSEAIGRDYIEAGKRSGLVTVNPYSQYAASGQVPEVEILGANREVAERSGNSWLLSMLSSGRPTFSLSSQQRRVLFHFRAGLDDEEIAARTYRSANSMKTTWDRIYDAIHITHPDLLKGRSKRPTLREYLRVHPEEVWPYAVRAQAVLHRASLVNTG